MPKITLTSQYLWSGVSYGPGETEVPQAFIDAYPDLKPPPSPEVLSGEPNLLEEEAKEAPLLSFARFIDCVKSV